MTGETLSSAFVDMLVARGTAVSFGKNHVVFHEGDQSDHVYLVRRGLVKIVIITPAGRELLIALKSPGHLFGELAALDGRCRSATSRATESTELLVVSGLVLLDSLEADPTLGLSLLRALATQLRAADQRTASRNGADTQTRLAQRLLLLGEAYGEHDQTSESTRLRLTQDDLAGWIGATREATARALAGLRKEGILTTGRERIDITDAEQLAVVAAGWR